MTLTEMVENNAWIRGGFRDGLYQVEYIYGEMVIVDVSRFYSTETSYTFCNL
jgi:hypothetical protein